MNKIISIDGATLHEDNNVDEEMVDEVAALLERVKSGDIRGVIYFAEGKTGLYHTFRCGPFDVEKMIGHFQRMTHHLFTLLEDDDD